MNKNDIRLLTCINLYLLDVLLCSIAPVIVKMATSVYKAIHGYKIPRGIRELLHERSTNYNLRGKHILELPKVNTTTYGLKSWRYTAAKIWNSFPDQFRAAALHELRFVFSIIIHKISSELLNDDACIVSENANAIKQIIVEPANEPSKPFCIRIICLIIIDLYFANYQSQKS